MYLVDNFDLDLSWLEWKTVVINELRQRIYKLSLNVDE